MKASCSCGFVAENLMLGGGMRNFQTFYGAPGMCQACGEFVGVNYRDPGAVCSLCGGSVRLYNDPAMQQGPNDTDEKPSWDELRQEAPPKPGQQGNFWLPRDATYLCPQCHQRQMRFLQSGMWD